MNAPVELEDGLRRLAPGVLIHVHDIFLPWDYPPDWVEAGRDRTAIFLARLNIVALLERCVPRTISAASNAISPAPSFGIKTTSSFPSLGSAVGAIGNPPATKRPFATTTL